MLITINLLLIWCVSLMHTYWLRNSDRELNKAKDHQDYLGNRLRETEKFADGLDKHLWMLNDRLDLLECTVNKQCTYEVDELPETDIETVKEAIK